MAIKLDPDDLFQGTPTAVSDAVFGSPTGNTVTITSAANLPTLAANEFFAIRDHSQAVNNGLYQATGSPTTSSVTCDKVSGSNPVAAGSEAITTLGTTGAATELSIYYDTQDRADGVYLLEQGNLDADGVSGQAVYSRMMKDWKDDAFLIANAPFPMFVIDADAGKALIGQDASGNNNGWNWADNTGFSIRTRKLIRSFGWTEINTTTGAANRIYSGIVTLGGFEDTVNDFARYQFGNNTEVDDTVQFDFAGPVNEAILCYDATVTRAVTTPNGYDLANTSPDTIVRNDGGSFITDGYKVGGRVVVENATTAANNGTYEITAVVAGTLTVTAIGGADAGLNGDTDDNTATLAVDNRVAFKMTLRVRDADPNGKTYGQANLASGGYATLSNRQFSFPLANAADLKISATDGTISGSSPYTGMTLSIYSTPQSLGGAGGNQLVGGPYNFGFVIECNSGTSVQTYEFIQYLLRQATDVDSEGANPAIGRTLDGLMRFLGDALEAGSTDGGLTFPTNPQGGGSGVFLQNLNSASRNSTTMFDNTGTSRGFPIGTPVTLDFNQTLIDDTLAAYTLFFDYTIRHVMTDLIITAVSGATGTFDSAGAGLTASIDGGDGQYVRVSGLTGIDAAMNGIYQVTVTTSTSQWDVTRVDGNTIVTTSSAAANIDEHAVDSPSYVIVQDNSPANVTGTASADFAFTFDYSNNVQGGRTGATDAVVVARAIGQSTAQFAQSSLQTIQSGVALVIPVTAQIERNFNDPA